MRQDFLDTPDCDLKGRSKEDWPNRSWITWLGRRFVSGNEPVTTLGWDRVGAIAGFAFVALFVAAFFGLQGADFPPAGSASAEQIRAFFEREHLRMALSTINYTAAWTALLLFIAAIRSPGSAPDSVRRLEWVAGSSSILVAGLALAGVALQSEILLADPTTDGATLVSQLALFASSGLFGVTPLPRAAFVGALSLVALRAGGLRRWLG